MSRFLNVIRQAASLSIVLSVLSLVPSLAPSLALAAPPPAGCAKAQLTGVLNVNTASAEQWALLPGIGPSTAAKIVNYRQRHVFSRVSQMMRIKGIGKKTYARLKPFLRLDGETTLARGRPPSSFHSALAGRE